MQLWVNDSRTYGTSRIETVAAGTNTVALDYNNTLAEGGVGQRGPPAG